MNRRRHSRILFGRRRELDPRTIEGLGLWLRGDVAYTSVSPDVQAVNGESVRRWPDLSGNSRHFDQTAGGSKPSFVASGINGRPALTADGVDDVLLAVGGFDLLRNRAGFTQIVVAQGASGTVSGTQNLLFISTPTANTTRSTIGRAASNVYNLGGRRLDANSISNNQFGSTSTSPFYLTGLVDYAAAVSTPYLNGIAQAPTNPFQTAGNTSDTDSSVISAFANGAGSSGFSGRIAEILSWVRVLPSAELAQVFLYINKRYSF